MRTRTRAAVAALTGVGTAASALVAATVTAGPAQASACTQADSYYSADPFLGSRFESIGNAVGKYNGTATASPMSFASTTTVSAATEWSQEVGVTGEWNPTGFLNIAKVTVSAKIGHKTVDTVTRGTTVTDQITVQPNHYGYVVPTIQRQRYAIERHQVLANCSERVTQVGVLDAIIASPFFMSCEAATPCDPMAGRPTS